MPKTTPMQKRLTNYNVRMRSIIYSINRKRGRS